MKVDKQLKSYLKACRFTYFIIHIYCDVKSPAIRYILNPVIF